MQENIANNVTKSNYKKELLEKQHLINHCCHGKLKIFFL